MSGDDGVRREWSEDKVGDGEKMVCVGEAIRYRKRAQAAEAESASLEQEVRELRSSNERLSGELREVRTEQELAGRLSAAGVCDMEAAVLLAKARLAENSGADIDEVVVQLRKEKSYLFDSETGGSMARRTSGVKVTQGGERRVLESRAKQAVESGSRRDLYEYMRAKRLGV